MILDKQYWENRYVNDDSGWDIGEASTPIKEYIDQLIDKNIRILIPGCGNAYEAEYLFNNGFSQVYLIDLSPSALKNFSKRVPSFPKENLICADFFEHNSKYDLIIEQTFFCAIDPPLRNKYAKHAANLLRENGKLVGLLFNDPLNTDHPPFGGNKEEYVAYFKPYFTIEIMEESHNSIPPRAGRELFIKLISKN